jgi:hypothetical protein
MLPKIRILIVESDRLPLLANILSDFTARSLRGFFFMNRCCESQ